MIALDHPSLFYAHAAFLGLGQQAARISDRT